MRRLLLFCIVTVLISCKPIPSEEPEKCRNESILLSIDSLSPIIEIDFNLSNDSTLLQISNQHPEYDCWQELNINLKIDEQLSIRANTYKTCVDSIVIWCYRPMRSLSILVNSSGQVLLANKPLEIDSISDWIGDAFSRQGKNQKDKSQVQWDQNVPIDSLVKVFYEIQEGYLIAYNRISIARFNKPSCSLLKHELDSLRIILPNVTILGLGRKTPRPPKFPLHKGIQALDVEETEIKVSEID